MKKFVFAAALAAAAIAAVPALSAETPLKFSLDWKLEGPAAPFLLALEKGYFSDEGLAVTIDTGAGSLEPINRVASGAYDMGFGDINSLIKFNDQNPDSALTAIYMVYNKPAFAIIGRKSLGVAAPKDLEGKTLGAPAPDGAYAQWPIFVKANEIDASKVTIENVGFPVREPMLAQGAVQAITGFSFSSFINLKTAGVPADDIAVLLMADYGVELYGNAILVAPAYAEAHPDAVKGFLAAFNKAMKEVIADPQAAVKYVTDANPVVTQETELERLQMAIDQNIVTDEVKADGLGAVKMDRLTTSIDQIALTFDFSAKPSAESVFDPSYLPQKEEREVE
ncbi:ABC transporter substrate-binding protein [Afifella sp. IM 167]|uniref:ABC transporter substrate-binding protein n=1 Tax=Afifella sp. IM 167 TaxID=2033586 RepID=UPI001CCD05E9|nr:ABC transporter substrate-binding protein [Afifella sp. IM 167]MBZ8133987.1 ABC transporter substrate-binding protein [Afifella sp. IM 167]